MNILIVEDDPSLSEVLTIVARREGHDPFVAFNGREALRKLEEQDFALLIVDARMPHMDGPRFIRTVRANPATANITIFGMTAATEVEDLRALEEAGADRLIKKPFRMPNLRQAIREALGPNEG